MLQSAVARLGQTSAARVADLLAAVRETSSERDEAERRAETAERELRRAAGQAEEMLRRAALELRSASDRALAAETMAELQEERADLAEERARQAEACLALVREALARDAQIEATVEHWLSEAIGPPEAVKAPFAPPADTGPNSVERTIGQAVRSARRISESLVSVLRPAQA